MYLAQKFSKEQERMMERVKSGADEARVVRCEVRKKRLKRNIGKELRALSILDGAIKGAATRRNWNWWTSILEAVKEEVYEE